MTFPAASFFERSALRAASSRRAPADSIWARSTSASSSTRICPSRAICPDSKRILLTVPAISLLTATFRRLEMLPIADTPVSQGSALAARRSDRLRRRTGRLHLLAHRHELADLGALDSRQQADDDQEAGRHHQVSFPSAVSRHAPSLKADRLSCHPGDAKFELLMRQVPWLTM